MREIFGMETRYTINVSSSLLMIIECSNVYQSVANVERLRSYEAEDTADDVHEECSTKIRGMIVSYTGSYPMLR